MKVLILSDQLSPHTQKWISSIKTYGDAEVCLIDTSLFHGTKKPALKIARYLFLYLKALYFYFYLRPDIIHGHYVSSYGLIATLLPSRKIILSAWGSDILNNQTRNSLSQKLLTFSLNRSKFTFADSEDLIIQCRKISPSDGRYKLINWGIDLSKFKISSQDFQEIRFISIRNFEPIYNIPLIIDSFNKLCSNFGEQKFSLEIFGRGSLESEIKNLISQSPYQSCIKLRGFVPLETVYESLSHSNCMITVPVTDGTASSLLEAMACGLFIIGSDLPANREWVNNENGILVNLQDKNSLAEAMESYSKLPNEFKQKASLVNRETISERANQETEFTKILNYYREVYEK